VSPFATKKTVAACKRLKYVEKVIVIGGKISDNLAISLDDFVKKFEKTNLDVDRQVHQKVNMKEQVAMILCSSGTTGKKSNKIQ
jgi:acyl-coenzyme A synthetase/AMP-(fatty) acid ligase